MLVCVSNNSLIVYLYVQGFGCSFAGERILSIDKLTYEFYIACFASPALHTKVHIGSSSYVNWISMLSGQLNIKQVCLVALPVSSAHKHTLMS